MVEWSFVITGARGLKTKRTEESPAGSLRATNATANISPALAVDNFGYVYASRVGNSNDVAAMQPACSDGLLGTMECIYGGSVDDHDTFPSVTQHTGSDHIIHSGTVCTSGTGCSGGDSCSVADFFQVALDPQHRANISYADDHLASPLCSQQGPGHRTNNDPQSFRVSVPCFGYQLKANKDVVTAGLCAR